MKRRAVQGVPLPCLTCGRRLAAVDPCEVSIAAAERRMRATCKHGRGAGCEFTTTPAHCGGLGAL